MYLFVVAFMMAVVHATFSVNDDLKVISETRLLSNQRQDIVEVSKGVLQYHEETGMYPVSLDVLANTQGYEYLRTVIDRQPRIEYELADISGATYEFSRFIVFIQDHFELDTKANYLANNDCGADAFSVSLEFCPNPSSSYFIQDNRNDFINMRIRGQYALDQTLAKLIMWGGMEMPFSAIGNGTEITLATEVGYLGDYENCTGEYFFGDAVLNCEDLFNEWGNSIVLNKISDTNVALMSVLPFTTSLGDAVYLLRDIQL